MWPRYERYYDMGPPPPPGWGKHTWPGANPDYFRQGRFGYSTQAYGTRAKRQARKRMRAAQSARSRKANRK
jgi:hypothetical protein